MFFGGGAPPQGAAKSRKSLLSAGNLSMQKYDASKHLKRFYRALTCPVATSETSDWKSKERKKYIELAKLSSKRNSGRQRMQERIQKQENIELASQIYRLKTENRREITREVGPGWRVGSKGGLVIDCYPTENPLIYKYSELHSFEKKEAKRQKEILRDNLKLKQDMNKYKSQLNAAILQKSYEEMRQRIFHTPLDTELHLGLLAEISRENQGKKRPQSGQSARGNLLPQSTFLNKKWNDDTSLLGPRPLISNPEWDFEPLKEYATKQRYHPIYGNNLSLEKAAVSYSPLHTTGGSLRFYTDLRNLASGTERKDVGRGRPSSAGHYGRSGSTSNQLRATLPAARMRTRPASAGATYRPQVLLRPLGQTSPSSAGDSPPKSSGRSKWMRQLPPYAARDGENSLDKQPRSRDEPRMPLGPPRGQRGVAALRHAVEEAAAAEAAAAVAAEDILEKPNNEAPPVQVANAPPQFQKRNLCLFEGGIAVASGTGGCAVPMRLSISDSGVIVRTTQISGTSNGRESGEEEHQLGSVFSSLSSGLMIEVQSEQEENLRGKMFLGIRKLRELCDTSGSEGNLYAELLALRCRDKKAALFDCLADGLSSSAETALCDMLIRQVKAQVSSLGEILIWI